MRRSEILIQRNAVKAGEQSVANAQMADAHRAYWADADRRRSTEAPRDDADHENRDALMGFCD